MPARKVRLPAAPLVGILSIACGHAPRADHSTDRKDVKDIVVPAEQAEQLKGLRYPVARVDDVVDDYHGTKVADPYRWLEDADSPETAAWVEAENKVTFDYLDGVAERPWLKERLTRLWDYERYGAPMKEGGKYFFFKNDGLQNQAVLYWASALDATPQVLLDPNTLSADGTVALGGMAITQDGKLMAYSLSVSGSDWQTWHVREVETGKDRPDLIEWTKFGGVEWSKDGQGFYYTRYDKPDEAKALEQANYFQKLYYHRLGDAQDKDTLVYKRDDQKEWGFGTIVTEDGQYLVIIVTKGTDPKNQVFTLDLKKRGAKVVEVLTGFEHGYSYLANDGPRFYFKTDVAAPRGRIIAVDLRKPAAEHWQEIVPQAAETIGSVNVLDQNKIVVSYLKDAHTQVRIFDIGGLDGKLVRDVTLPGLGTAGGFGGRRAEVETFYSYTDYVTPTTIYRYDVKSGASTVFKKPTVDFDPSAFETEQVFFQSKDGTRVPMYLTHKKGLVRDGTNPTYLYGYGGFDIALTPGFDVGTLVWLELGGIYAVANLRGGGEYGEEWHKAGTLDRKQNVFDDFIAAAEWLIDHKYTSTPRLAIGGGSNGGLLVGACMTQRPELFGAALPAVGVMDMLRFHKFTIGWAWVDDYGSSDDPAQFKSLYAYSPYHNLVKGTKYPATMVTTADHDDRVVPGHSFKFAAALQAAQGGEAPVLIRIDTKAGHGAGKPTAKVIETIADKWAFLVKVFAMDVTKGDSGK